MKKFLLALFATITVANPILAQKNNSNSDKGDGLLAAGALALGAAAAALEYQLWLEEVELMAFRHILDSRPGESACRVKLLTSDAKKMTDNSSSQAMVFAITFFDEKQQEVIETIREIVKKTKQTSTHCLTIYDKTKKKLKRKKLHKELTEHELLELCNDVWAARLCGLEY